MKVDLIAETKSDLTVVNAARCSFDKESSLIHEGPLCTETLTEWEHDDPKYVFQSGSLVGCKTQSHWVLSKTDSKLIAYLANHRHWTPFGHPQEAFRLEIAPREQLWFLYHANLSGFEWVQDFGSPFGSPYWSIRGSLYAWLTNMKHLPLQLKQGVHTYLYEQYPVSFGAFHQAKVVDLGSGVVHLDNPQEDELKTYTLRIHCPIFVKRQLETHRRGFVMTDIEDFSQNEVSRRYVNTEPEIYHPEFWRVQAKDKKQGSETDTQLPHREAYLCTMDYDQLTYSLPQTYKSFNQRGVAHEQSRMVLPLSTYTTFWWTASLKSYRRLFGLRLQADVQDETRELTELIYQAIP